MTRVLVLVLAILQPIASYLSSIGNPRFMNQASNPLITPASYAFAIWGVITFGALLYALYQVWPKRRNKEVYERIAPYAAGVFAGFSIWLYAAQQDWLWATVFIFIGMGLCLAKLYPIVLEAVSRKAFSMIELVIVYGTFGLYAGWTTVAIFANIAAAIKFYGVSDLGDIGIVWQALVLITAAVTAIIFTFRTKGSIPYTATLLWAFVAIVIGTLERGAEAEPLLLIAIVATIALVGSYLMTLRRTRRLAK